MSVEPISSDFQQLDLCAPVLRAVEAAGYQKPTQIQELTIPLLLAGHDLVGQAQTGTGKTAAFALPVLSQIDIATRDVQALVLTPTRELAIQVSDSFRKYGCHLNHLAVLTVYGGQEYSRQIRPLRRGVHVVVGTPGRVMDHLRRKTLRLGQLKTLVLDEADEMLRMGFVEDVEWILEQAPTNRQTALFSATMPPVIRKIARRHLCQPQELYVQGQSTAAQTVRQRYWQVAHMHRLDALSRILETENTEGVIVFVNTRAATFELAAQLEDRGFSAAPINGDMDQKLREHTIEQLRIGKLRILVATDVAARGLDVERVSHVINYDMSSDREAYVHRIGRTGRAGRKGEAISFVSGRQKRLLQMLRKTSRQPLEAMEIPTSTQINELRRSRFAARLAQMAKSRELDFYRHLVTQVQKQYDLDPTDLAAALAKIAQGNTPFLLKEDTPNANSKRSECPRLKHRVGSQPEEGMDRYRIEVGHQQGVTPSDIVGAIANEGQLSGRSIGKIVIFDQFSTVDLPQHMPKKVFNKLTRVFLCEKRMALSRLDCNKRCQPDRVGKKGSSSKKARRQKHKLRKKNLQLKTKAG